MPTRLSLGVLLSFFSGVIAGMLLAWRSPATSNAGLVRPLFHFYPTESDLSLRPVARPTPRMTDIHGNVGLIDYGCNMLVIIVPGSVSLDEPIVAHSVDSNSATVKVHSKHTITVVPRRNTLEVHFLDGRCGLFSIREHVLSQVFLGPRFARDSELRRVDVLAYLLSQQICDDNDQLRTFMANNGYRAPSEVEVNTDQRL